LKEIVQTSQENIRANALLNNVNPRRRPKAKDGTKVKKVCKCAKKYVETLPMHFGHAIMFQISFQME